MTRSSRASTTSTSRWPVCSTASPPPSAPAWRPSRSTWSCGAASTRTASCRWRASRGSAATSCASSSTWTSATRTAGTSTRSCRPRRSCARIDAEMPLEALPPDLPGRGGDRWRYRDGGGEVGVISSVTRAVLRRLHPCPAHGRGPALHLPLRGARHRPAGPLRAGRAMTAPAASSCATCGAGGTDRYSELRSRRHDAAPQGRDVAHRWLSRRSGRVAAGMLTARHAMAARERRLRPNARRWEAIDDRAGHRRRSAASDRDQERLWDARRVRAPASRSRTPPTGAGAGDDGRRRRPGAGRLRPRLARSAWARSLTSTAPLPGPAGLTLRRRAQTASSPSSSTSSCWRSSASSWRSSSGGAFGGLSEGAPTVGGSLDAGGRRPQRGRLPRRRHRRARPSASPTSPTPGSSLRGTPGMRMLGLRSATRADGHSISWDQALVRWLLLGIAATLATFAVYVPSLVGLLLAVLGLAWLSSLLTR